MCRTVILSHRAQKINRFCTFGIFSKLKTAITKKHPSRGAVCHIRRERFMLQRRSVTPAGSGDVIADQTNSGEFFVFKIKRFLRKSISPSSRILPSSTDKPLRSTDR